MGGSPRAAAVCLAAPPRHLLPSPAEVLCAAAASLLHESLPLLSPACWREVLAAFVGGVLLLLLLLLPDADEADTAAAAAAKQRGNLVAIGRGESCVRRGQPVVHDCPYNKS